MEITHNQFSGCLIGQCVGDALGFVVEGQSPVRCREYVNTRVRPGNIEGWSGQYSDDSQLARELMQSLVACRTFDPADYARRVCAIFAEGRIVGPGQGAKEAAARLAQGAPWDQAGTPAPAAGNGTAMRVAPIGLFFAGDPGQMLQAAQDQARVTHLDSRCTAGAIAIAGTVSLTACNPAQDPAQFMDRVSDWCRPVDTEMSEALRRISVWREMAPEPVREEIKTIGTVPGEWSHVVGIPPFVTQSVLWSLYAFVRSPDDYREAICLAMLGGGDVDTTAAMTGAMSGARLGLEAIPDQWARRVNDNGTWAYEALVELAEQCRSVGYID